MQQHPPSSDSASLLYVGAQQAFTGVSARVFEFETRGRRRAKTHREQTAQGEQGRTDGGALASVYRASITGGGGSWLRTLCPHHQFREFITLKHTTHTRAGDRRPGHVVVYVRLFFSLLSQQ